MSTLNPSIFKYALSNAMCQYHFDKICSQLWDQLVWLMTQDLSLSVEPVNQMTGSSIVSPYERKFLLLMFTWYLKIRKLACYLEYMHINYIRHSNLLRKKTCVSAIIILELFPMCSTIMQKHTNFQISSMRIIKASSIAKKTMNNILNMYLRLDKGYVCYPDQCFICTQTFPWHTICIHGYRIKDFFFLTVGLKNEVGQKSYWP